MLLQMVIFHSFLWLKTIPLYIYHISLTYNHSLDAKRREDGCYLTQAREDYDHI